MTLSDLLNYFSNSPQSPYVSRDERGNLQYKVPQKPVMSDLLATSGDFNPNPIKRPNVVQPLPNYKPDLTDPQRPVYVGR